MTCPLHLSMVHLSAAFFHYITCVTFVRKSLNVLDFYIERVTKYNTQAFFVSARDCNKIF